MSDDLNTPCPHGNSPVTCQPCLNDAVDVSAALAEMEECAEPFAIHPTWPHLVAICTLPSGHDGEHDNLLPKAAS